MPTTYTHYRFGQQVLRQLSIKLHARIDAHHDLFNLGVHGPDILFYYHPLTTNPVNRVGHSMHLLSGRTVFRRLLALDDGSDTGFAYLAGFLCHFVLDSSCHGLIGEMEAQGLSHTLQETQLDRSFLLEDGLDPIRQDLTAHIHPSVQDIRTIARFFPQVTEGQVAQALKGMQFYHRLLSAKNQPKRKLLRVGCDLIGARETFGYMVMQEGEVSACRSTVERLRTLYEQAVPLAAALIAALPDLHDSRYDYDFEGILHPQEEGVNRETDEA